MMSTELRDVHFAEEIERLSPSFEQITEHVEPSWLEVLALVPTGVLWTLSRLMRSDRS